jgi:citrate lyase subunit beta/citryl-CoA lyase
MARAAEAGRKGPDVRSDCWVSVAPADAGGLSISVKSKVEVMYGDAIRAQVRTGLEALGVKQAVVEVEDFGALPFVLMARLETAARRAYGEAIAAPWLPEAAPETRKPTRRDRFRRSRLYLPGNEPKFMFNAGLHAPDGVILDLEDSVAPSEKDAARLLVRNSLRTIDFRDAERMVRINQGALGLEDLDAIIPENVHVVLIPKCESAETVREIDARIAKILGSSKSTVLLMPILESGLGVLRALEIATAVPSVIALTIGLEDYTADIGAQRTAEGRESFFARSMIVAAARAAGVAPIDTVFSDVADPDGLRASVVEAKGLGFEGKGCIHPNQIRVIHDAFAPTPDEIAKSTRIVRAFEEAQAKGLAVVSLGSKMIDPPVVKRALRTVDLAVRSGRLVEGWRQADAGQGRG